MASSESADAGRTGKITVHVAIYEKPNPSEAAKWAVWLHGPEEDEDVTLQITKDDKDQFKVDEAQECAPQDCGTLDRTIVLGEIESNGSLEDAAAIIESEGVDNDDKSWNSQNWVMDCLEALEEKGLYALNDSKKEELNALREKCSDSDAKDAVEEPAEDGA